MRRIIVGALLSVAFLASPIWARPEHGRSYHGGWNNAGWNNGGWNRSFGYGWGYGYGYPLRPWYVGRTYVAPTYVTPEYPIAPEYRATYRGDAGALVNAWYGRYLGRDMDPAASAWIDEIRTGLEPSLVLSGILASDEYFQRGGATPSGFVERLYVDVAGRRPSRAEMDSALGQASVDRQGVAYGILQQHPDAVMIR
ncbi:MAG TPA: hypothetical protein VGG61_16730 [Gemmataceae bacterium]